MNPQIQKVIDRLEQMPKQGESYDHKGRHGWANPIRADTGAILRSLVKARFPSVILEIGTAHGLSGCYLASELPSEGLLVTIEWDEHRSAEAIKNFEEAGLTVQTLCGNALEIIPTLKLRFGLIFLDANKDGYLEQFKLLLECDLLAPDCLVIADNVIDRQTECQDFLDYMQQFDPVILGTECGLLVAKV